MTRLLWVLAAALVALVITRVALQWRAGRKSPMQALARDYLAEQLTAKGIAHLMPSRYLAEIAQRYADAVESRPLGRLAAASELMKRIDTGIAFIAEWLRDGRKFPQSIAEMPLPGLGVLDALQQDALHSED